MCVGMFMAILDIQIVATSLPTIQSALGIAPDQMSWVQTAYLIAEVIAIPLTGFLTRAAEHALAVRRRRRRLHPGLDRLRGERQFSGLIAWRVLQGFSGGTLIPAVFSAVFLLFPVRRQGLATTIAGVLAVLAPTVGPIVGGWITETYSWHWLFLVNVLPGLAVDRSGRRGSCRGQPIAPRARPARSTRCRWSCWRSALAALEIGLKEAPERGWISGLVLGLLGAERRQRGRVSCGARSRRRRRSSSCGRFADRRFAIGCMLSFVLGIGLFGSVYLMPVFLAFVRGHDALEIGDDHAGHRRRPTAHRAGRRRAGAARRRAPADRRRLRGSSRSASA